MSTADYDSAPDPAFSQGVTHFPWLPWKENGVQIGWVAAGDCPRCGHLMAVYRRRIRGVDRSSSITAACNCVQPHGGRPVGTRQGCGQSAVVNLSTWDRES